MHDYQEIYNRFKANGQEHVFAGWSALAVDEQAELLADCAAVDLAWVNARWEEFNKVEAAGGHVGTIEPAPIVTLPATDADRAAMLEAKAIGEQKLRDGKVAAFLVAGGQGTRLGYDGPKGRYPIGPVGNRSLFQWHAEQIIARGRRYGPAIPWYIMTSRDNDADTKQFFEENNFFGMDRRDVFFFQQEMVPCLDFGGKLMLAAKSRLARNPNGHGGSLSGLVRSGAVEDMLRRGIETITYFQVDNPMVTIGDPVYLGWHVKFGADMSSKVLEKNAPEEPIGVVCLRDGKPCVVEYTDLDAETMRARGPDGKLLFWAGSIAIHMIQANFAHRFESSGRLPWHRNRKKVPYYDGEKMVKPSAENAVKFETFVFDALPHADVSVNFEVLREHEFAPVKNATGKDSAVSCRHLMSEYFQEWLDAAGIKQSAAMIRSEAEPMVEVSPLYALDGEELATKVKPEGFVLERALLLQ